MIDTLFLFYPDAMKKITQPIHLFILLLSLFLSAGCDKSGAYDPALEPFQGSFEGFYQDETSYFFDGILDVDRSNMIARFPVDIDFIEDGFIDNLISRKKPCRGIISVHSNTLTITDNNSCPCKCDCLPNLECLGYQKSGEWTYRLSGDSIFLDRAPIFTPASPFMAPTPSTIVTIRSIKSAVLIRKPS